jgi:feruloyl-CoA synthase
MAQPRFWTPQFNIEHRPDGTILMQHTGTAPRLADTVVARIGHWAATTPDRTAFAQRGADGAWQRLSYGDLWHSMRHLGAGLLARGLGQDRPVLILSENALDHAVLALAGQYAGVPTAALSTAFSLVSDSFDKLRDAARLLRPGLVYASDGARYGRALAALGDDALKVCSVNAPGGALSFRDLPSPDPAPADTAFAALRGDMVAKYLFTSGSTGSPKAVINTHDMIARNQDIVADCFRFLADHPPVVVDWAPWSHTASGNKVFHMVLCNGGTYHIDEGKPTPALIGRTLDNLRDVSPTWYFNVPAGYEMLLEAFRTDPALAARFFEKLDMMMYAGAGMAQHIWEGLRQMAHQVTGRDVLLTTGLGATETGPFALMCTTPQDAPGNVGVPSRGITLKLVPNEGKLEARLRSPSITPGYLGDAATSAKMLDDEGFYCLGDALRPADPDDLTKGFFFDGRIAENFKLATGTWVAVGALRARLVDHFGGLIRDAVILGEDRPALAALLFPAEGVMDRPGIMDEMARLHDSFATTSTGSSTRIARMLILRDPPSLDRGEVTDKGSINARAVIRHRPDAVSQVYGAPEGIARE